MNLVEDVPRRGYSRLSQAHVSVLPISVVRYVSSADQKADILTKLLPAAAHARHFEALGLGRPYASAERAAVHLAAAINDLEGVGNNEKALNDKVSRGPIRLPHNVVETERRNPASQPIHQLAHHEQRFVACARGMRDCMHAGGAGGHQGEAGLPGDTKITETGEEMTENGRIASKQPGGGRSLDRAPSASVVPGPYCHGAKIGKLQCTPEELEAIAETLDDDLQPADFEGEC